MMFMRIGLKEVITGWLAWERRSRVNRVLFVVTLSLAAFVTLAFAWATVNPSPGDFARYFAFYWVWGLCAVALIFGMAEYKTSPLRKRGERGHLFLLLYVGALLIVTRALNMILYWG
jgi:FtsH-binding integral membrane protein